MLKAGDTAPDFTAITTDGNTISLHDYQGRNSVVLYFYPKDDTSGCTKESCDFRDAKPLFDARNAVILGISMDDQDSHRHFTEKFQLNFPLVVDSDGAICDAYGVEHPNDMPYRTTFLIDTDGIIERIWERVSVLGHAEEVLGSIRG